MYPKSNVKLKLGDFCWVQRDGGGYVPFVFIQKVTCSRSYFHGAILNTCVDEKNAGLLKSGLKILSHAQLHIQCYEKNETPIIGNLRDKLSESSLEETKEEINCSCKSYVWGYRAIFRRASQVN